MLRKILETTGMIICVLVNDLESFRTARRQQKIVTADIVRDNRHHRAAPIRVEDVSFRQINRVRVIDASPRRKPFRFVFARKRDQIGDLFAFEIDDAERLIFLQFERDPGLRFELVAHAELMFERTFCRNWKWSFPIVADRAAGILWRFGFFAEFAQHGINASLNRQFARANRALHAFPLFFSPQSFELLMWIENQRWPGKTARLARAVPVHSDDIKSLSRKTK